MVGFHFRIDVRPDWKGLVAVFDERRLLGCRPPGPELEHPLVGLSFDITPIGD